MRSDEGLLRNLLGDRPIPGQRPVDTHPLARYPEWPRVVRIEPCGDYLPVGSTSAGRRPCDGVVTMMEGPKSVSEGGVAFDGFFRVEYPRLAALATALCGDREAGRDVAQEALARAFGEWDRVGRLQSPGGWARRVVVNLARDHWRHVAVRRRRLPQLTIRTAADGATDDRLLDAEMWAAVTVLPERQRIAVALFYIGDRSISEVAEVMGVHEGTVKTTLHNAREGLRRALSKEHP